MTRTPLVLFDPYALCMIANPASQILSLLLNALDMQLNLLTQMLLAPVSLLLCESNTELKQLLFQRKRSSTH